MVEPPVFVRDAYRRVHPNDEREGPRSTASSILAGYGRVARLEVAQADVTKLEVDAIANAANTQLAHGGGVAGAISRAGGPEVQRESNERAPIGLGEAVETTAGDMPARWVIHAATMELGGPTSADDRRARHPLDAGAGGAARLPLARAGGLRHRRGRLPAGGRGADHGGRRARARGRTRADRVRRARRRRPSAPSAPSCERPGARGPRQLQGHLRRRRGGRARSPPGLRGAGREAVELPVADGGEGTMDVLLATLGGRAPQRDGERSARAPCRAPSSRCWRTAARALVETAQASGLGLVAEDERDAWRASTRGTGELIAAAAAAGAERVVVTVGGSATTDGGAGALDGARRGGRGRRSSRWCATCARRSRPRRACSPRRRAPTPRWCARLERRLAELAGRLAARSHAASR